MRAVRLASVFSLALVGALLGAPPGAEIGRAHV